MRISPSAALAAAWQIFAWLVLAALVTIAKAETTVGELEPALGTWRVYDGTRRVCAVDSEQAMLACAAEDAERIGASTRYQLRYPNRYVTVAYSAPTDSDGDGVPDSADECPTVYAAGEPNGCPATPPQTWVHCANQGERCAFEGRRLVRYGAGDQWGEREFVDGVQCDNVGFGSNPAPGVLKTCELEDGPSEPEPEPEPEPAPAGTATLSWTPPTANVDGSTLTNLAGFRLAYGTTQDLAQSIQIANPAATRYVIEGLAPGTWYFSVRAYNSAGAQSDQSATIIKAVQ
jgi:hypothetical protein